MFRSTSSLGTERRAASARTRASCVFETGSAPPPSLTAATMSLPYLPYSFVRLASPFCFFAATLAALRPMQTGDDVSGRRDDGGDDATALDARRDATRARAYDARDASDATDDATVNADMTTTTTTRRAGGRGRASRARK